MSSALRFARRAVVAAVAGGAVALGVAGTAVADPPCIASDITGTEASVAAAMTGYLVTHPDVNDFFSNLQGLSVDEAFAKTRDYLTANPDVKAEIDAIRQPADDLRDRCGVPDSNIMRGVL
jgi:hemophore-related protein